MKHTISIETATPPAITASNEPSKTRRWHWFVLLIPVMAFVLIQPAVQARSAAFERFFGEYRGVSDSIPEGEVSKRDLSVTIKPFKNGFTIELATGIYKSGGRFKLKENPIAFTPTHRKNIYASAMRVDMFGHAVPLDPLKGDPFVWARISGKTLTVYAVRIMDSGAQDLQIYRRTLIPQGMDLEFIRLQDTDPIRRVTATLKKVGDI